MLRFTWFLCLFFSIPLFTTPTSTTSTPTDTQAVIELTPQTFDTTITKAGKTLVEFYAPWCGHCQQFAPDYEQVARTLKSKSIQVARIDGSKYRILSYRFQINSFPTFFLIDKQNVLLFDGLRSIDHLVEFAETKKYGKMMAKDWKYPLGIYWKAVSNAMGSLEGVVNYVEQKNISTNVLVIACVSALVALLSLFVLVIYVVTKPGARPKRD